MVPTPRKQSAGTETVTRRRVKCRDVRIVGISMAAARD